MIENSFSFLQGIGEKLEYRLWRSGILTWSDFLETESIAFLPVSKKNVYDHTLRRAQNNLCRKNATFFSELLRPRDHWKLFDLFNDCTVCLDIETNGYPVSAGGYVTVVGLYDGFDYVSLVRGRDLSPERVQDELSRYRYLITFFGTGFDIPFLREAMGIQFPPLHFDLCFGGKRAGLKGGLKKVEQLLGITREEAVRGFDGYDAVKLWGAYRRGEEEAGELLVSYNRCDTIHLFGMAETICRMLRAGTGLDACLEEWAGRKAEDGRP